MEVKGFKASLIKVNTKIENWNRKTASLRNSSFFGKPIEI